VTAIIGPNGAGKSTTFRIVCGLLQPDRGNVFWKGADLRACLKQRQLGFLPEERGLYQEIRVRELAIYWAQLREVDQRPAERVDHWLEKVGLTAKRKAFVRDLSKGNQQKLQLAVTMLHNPDLLVLDEPFSGLDPINQELVCSLLEEQKRRGAVVVLSAHQLALVEQLADRTFIINGGRVADDQVRGAARPAKAWTVSFFTPDPDAVAQHVRGNRGHVITVEPGRVRAAFPGLSPEAFLTACANVVAAARVVDFEVEREGLHQRYLHAVSPRETAGS
jgi:ABC-2 type transport system ATP-binding protein